LTPRPSWERIPAGVSHVVFTASGQTDSNRLGPVSAPRTLTGSRAHRLVAFINRAEIVQPGLHSCPVALAETVTLRFLAADDRVVARAVEDPTGCASVTLTLARRTGPELSHYPSVTEELLRLGAVPTCAAGKLTPSASRPGETARPTHGDRFRFSEHLRCDVRSVRVSAPGIGRRGGPSTPDRGHRPGGRRSFVVRGLTRPRSSIPINRGIRATYTTWARTPRSLSVPKSARSGHVRAAPGALGAPILMPSRPLIVPADTRSRRPRRSSSVTWGAGRAR